MFNKQHTKRSKDFLHDLLASRHKKPVDFEFNGTRFTAIYSDGSTCHDYSLNVGFRGNNKLFDRYLKTFK